MFTGTLQPQDGTFWPRACQRYFVYRRNFNWLHGCVYRVHYIITWGMGDRGFWLCGIDSLVMYRTPQRIVTKSLNRTAQPFSIRYLPTQWFHLRDPTTHNWNLVRGKRPRLPASSHPPPTPRLHALPASLRGAGLPPLPVYSLPPCFNL